MEHHKAIFLRTLLLISFHVDAFKNGHYSTSWKQCDKIIAGDWSPHELAYLSPRRSATVTRLSDCTQISRALEQNIWLSEEEKRYPIAYAISAYQSNYQLANLLRLIYRPHNLYCVHLDRRIPAHVVAKMHRMLSCFPSNVFLIPPEERVSVRWGHFDVLEAFMLCAKALYYNKQVGNWSFLLNVNEKELPLRTNWELVRALRALNGSNLVQGTHAEVDSRKPKMELPFNAKWVKGSFLVALQRKFVAYLLNNKHPLNILKAMSAERRLRKIPDEMLFATLVYNPQLGAPGACDTIITYNRSDPTTWVLARYVIWERESCSTNHMRHEVCILGRADLPTLFRTPHLFANKFLTCVQPETYHCLYYWITRKMDWERKRGYTDPSFDPSLYGEIYCSRMHT